MHVTLRIALALAGMSGAFVGGASDVLAQAAPAGPAAWWDSFKVSGYADGGITFNPDSPANGINFGHLYTDRANTPVLNQLSLILTRPLDPKATGFDYGFTFQPMYGTDARFTHFFNEFDRVINSRYQFDIVEADFLAHVPFPTEGGTDLKIGQYPTPIGYEVINPTGNPLYTHSYIYNFGIPIKHTGVLSTSHVSPLLDLYLGFDWGNLATPFGEKGDNNDAGAVLGGFGLNLLGGNLTILALTHIGPENSDLVGIPKVNSVYRYFNDIVLAYKASDKLTLTTEVNYVKDDLIIPGVVHQPQGYGVAQYASYAVNDTFTFQGRAEIWRDDQGFYVAAFPGNFDFTNANRGLPNTSFNAGKATYEELTLGVNVKLPLPQSMSHFAGTMVRPEIRFDHSDGAKPFNSLTSNHQVTIAADLVVPF